MGTRSFGDATVTMNLTGNEGATGEYWTTFYNENYRFQVPAEGTQIFKAALTGTALALTELETDKIVEKNNAVILKSTTGSISLTLTTTESNNDFSGNSLQGVDNPDGLEAANPSTTYVLNKKNDVVGFYKLKTGKKAGVGKAYLTYPDPYNAREFFAFEESTGINSMHNSRTASDYVDYRMHNEIYDLSGRRVTNPTKGLYIINGKKVIK